MPPSTRTCRVASCCRATACSSGSIRRSGHAVPGATELLRVVAAIFASFLAPSGTPGSIHGLARSSTHTRACLPCKQMHSARPNQHKHHQRGPEYTDIQMATRKRMTKNGARPLRLLIEKWFGSSASIPCRVTEFGRTRSNRRRYVCVEAKRATGSLAIFFFRHDDGSWHVFPPAAESTVSCSGAHPASESA